MELIRLLLTKRYQNDVKKALSVAQGALYAEPSRNENRSGLAALILQDGECHSSLSVLSGSPTINDLQALPKILTLRAVAFAMDKSSHKADITHREIQKAIMLSPSDICLWRALAYVRSQQISKPR
jgi:superkiller protein 3